MKIEVPCVVSLIWTLTDAQREPIDALTEPVEFLYGGEDLLPRLEQALDGHHAGYETSLHLEPEHAFGEYHADLVCFEDRALFPDLLEPGMQFEGLPAGARTPGMPADVLYTVTEVYPNHVVLDGNHPLAGIALNLDVTVVAVRAATDDEVAAGTVAESPLSLLRVAQSSAHLH